MNLENMSINAPAARGRAEAPGTVDVRKQRGLRNLGSANSANAPNFQFHGIHFLSLTETTLLRKNINSLN